MKRYRLYFSMLGLVLVLTGCGGGGTTTSSDSTVSGDDTSVNSDTTISSGTTTDVVIPSSYTPDDGRLLASGCFQCHGTNGISVNSWDSIAGEDNLQDEIFEKGVGHIMTAQADGYTSSEIASMENWLSKVSKTTTSNESDENDNDEGDDND